MSVTDEGSDEGMALIAKFRKMGEAMGLDGKSLTQFIKEEHERQVEEKKNGKPRKKNVKPKEKNVNGKRKRRTDRARKATNQQGVGTCEIASGSRAWPSGTWG